MMFFLDRKQYPRDDEFQAYLSEHGGFTNAFTADTHTNYYFNVRDEGLKGALERCLNMIRDVSFPQQHSQDSYKQPQV